MQSNTSRLAASLAARAAPAADGAPAEDIKFDPWQQSAIISHQDQNLTLEMQSIETGVQIRRAEADHDRAIADHLQKLNTHAATFDEYVEHAPENTCFSVLSICMLTQIARSHGYDSQSSAFNQLSTLLDSMR
jgi:hypothetical protein